MFIGHFATGFAAKRAAPKPSLGKLFMAATTTGLICHRGSWSFAVAAYHLGFLD